MDESERLVVDPLAGIAIYRSQWVPLPPREARLLALFVDGSNRVVTREEIVDRVWKGKQCNPRVVDVTVYRLRSKLKELGHPGIKTVFRRGYRLAA